MNKRILLAALSALMMFALLCGCTSAALPGGATDEPAANETDTPAPAGTDSPEPGNSDDPSGDPEDQPGANDPALEFPIVLKCGESFSIDLDGDGAEEEITYIPSRDGEDFPWEFDSLTINGEEFRDSIYDDEFYTDCLVTDYWAVTDIDSSDGALEIALMDYGPSDDNVTYFFRYTDGKPEYIGYVPGFVYNGYSDSSDMTFPGDGTVDSYMRLSVLQTWWAPASWKPGDERCFDLIAQELYYPFAGKPGSDVTVTSPIVGYAGRSADSERTVISAGTELTLAATDNREWILAKTGDGRELWLHLNAQDGYAYEIETERGYESGALVLDGLCMAD